MFLPLLKINKSDIFLKNNCRPLTANVVVRRARFEYFAEDDIHSLVGQFF